LRHEQSLDRERELLILPSARRSEFAEGQPSPHPGGRLLSTRVAGTEYAGLRRASVEDDARKVDWKVTARRGVTIVRETAGESLNEHHVDIVTRCGGEAGVARRRFEEQISGVAGQAQNALERGDTVHLSVDGTGTKTYVGPRALLQLLRRLAGLEAVAADGALLPAAPGTLVAPTSDSGTDGRSSIPGRALRSSALLSLAVGSVALFVGDGIGPLLLGMLLGSVAITVMSSRFVTRARSVGRRLWHVAAVVALVGYLLDILLLRRDLLAASLALTVFITLFALFNAKTADDDRRLLLVSFLHIVLAAALTTEVAIALPLMAWMLATIHGLTASTAICAGKNRRTIVDTTAGRVRYAAPTLGTAVFGLTVCLAVFMVVPHFGTGAFRPGMFRGNNTTGFSDSTTLGDIGRIKLDQTKVMEVDVSGAKPPKNELRWRGLALNAFDGRTWTRSYSPYSRLVADGDGIFYPGATMGLAASSSLMHQEIRLEPGPATALFAAAAPSAVASRDFRLLGEDGFGNLEFPAKPTRRLSYSVASRVPTKDAAALRDATGVDPPEVRALNLAVPELDPRIRQLAGQITTDTRTRYDAAVAIEQWLSSRLDYSLAVDDLGATDPLARFLFDGMAGHCEYFATAMVVLSREAGIPSRFVAGYLRGEKVRFNDRYVVRQSNAHSWVEVYFPGTGWVPFDPTPPTGRGVGDSGGLWALATYLHSTVTRLWDDYLVGIDLDDQARGLLALTAFANRLSDRLRSVWVAVAAWHPLGLTLIAGGLVVLVYAGRRTPHLLRARRRRRKVRSRQTALPSFYSAALELLSKRGISRRDGETPAELAERAERLMTRRSADRLRELTRLYYRVRFDGVTSEREVSRIARALVGDVRTGLRN
jgi:uncharacterized protein (DUF58 family)